MKTLSIQVKWQTENDVLNNQLGLETKENSWYWKTIKINLDRIAFFSSYPQNNKELTIIHFSALPDDCIETNLEWQYLSQALQQEVSVKPISLN
jgi:hypothetical protein